MNDSHTQTGTRNGVVSGDWFGLSFQQQCDAVERAQAGEVWRNRKTGKLVTIKSVDRWRGVTLLHATGRETTKQCHYFAYDYCPNDQEEPRHE